MSSLLFGEIVEPTTRALIDDDLEEYPEYIQPLEWEGNCETPNQIDTLVFVETEKVKKLLNSCVLLNLKSIGKLKSAGVEIYNIKENVYVITHFEQKDFNTGEIVEAFENWIKIAKHIYAVTSDSIYNYQNGDLYEKPSALLRMLSNDPEEKIHCGQLETPNLVTGLGANVLSYCIHTELKCTLFIAYVDNSPLDSANIGVLLDLFTRLDIPVSKKVITERGEDLSSSNLYI
nr:uncharacterized protein LOC111513786 [Leptinotarsa decemlineata]